MTKLLAKTQANLLYQNGSRFGLTMSSSFLPGIEENFPEIFCYLYRENFKGKYTSGTKNSVN